MPVMPGGNFVPQSVLQGGTGQSVMPQAMGTGTPNAAAGANAQTMGGPGQGGAATAQTAEAQLPAAQQAAGMQPAQPQQPQQAPPQPGQPPAQQAPPQPPQPGFIPNSQGQQLYMPGQGPVTEKVPPLADMANQPVAAEPRGHMDVPLDANAQVGQMELMASDNNLEPNPFDLLGRVFEEYYDRPAQTRKTATVPAGLLSGLTETEIARLQTGNEKTGGLERVAGRNNAVAGDGLLADLPRSAAVKLAGGKPAFDLESPKERRDPDGTSNMPWDKAQRDEDDDTEVEDPSDLEDEGENASAVPYDDNGKPRPSWKESMDRMSQLSPGREYTPGEDCAYCGVSMEKGDGGVCNRCGHDYDSGKDRKFGKDASVIGTHGVPMVSTEGDMRQSSAGEGDTSSLLVAPWSQNGADAWKDLNTHSGRTGAKGNSTFGGLLGDGLDTMSGMNPAKQASGDELAFKAWKAKGLSDEEADAAAGDPSMKLPAEKKARTNYSELLSGHGQVKCSECDKRLVGCRCPSFVWKEAKHETVLTVCDECVEAKKTAAVEPLPRWAPPGPPKAFPELAGQPGVTNFLASLGLGFDPQGYVKQAMIGDDGSTTADPFGGGLILGQQQAEDPMDNPGTLLEAGLGDNQGDDTTAQPSDHGQHDATVAPFSNGIDVNVFKQGSFGYGFVQACQAKGLAPEFIHLVAVKTAEISDTIAEELEPLTKQALTPTAPSGVWSGIRSFGSRMLGFADDAARTVAKVPRGAGYGAAGHSPMGQVFNMAKAGPKPYRPYVPVPDSGLGSQLGARAQNAWTGVKNTGTMLGNAGRRVSQPVKDLAVSGYNAAYGNRSPAYQMGARLAVGGGAGTVADINEAYNTGSYEPTFMAAGLLGGARPGGLGRTVAGYGLGATADMLTGNQYRYSRMGALGGAASGLLPKGGLPGAARELTSPKAFGRATGMNTQLAKDPFIRGAQMAGGGLAASELAAGLSHGSGYIKGVQQTTQEVSNVSKAITHSAGADPLKYTSQSPDGQYGFDQEGFLNEAMQSPQGQKIIKAVMENPENVPLIMEQAAQMMPEIVPIAKQLGAIDPNTGQIDINKLRAGMAKFSSGGGMSMQLDKMGLGWAKPMIDFAVQNPIGMAIVGGGVLMLLGSLMGGGGSMGLLGAGAMALGAFGGLDGLAQQSGLFGGGQQPQAPGSSAESPLEAGPPPGQSLGSPASADEPAVSPLEAGTGEVNPGQASPPVAQPPEPSQQGPQPRAPSSPQQQKQQQLFKQVQALLPDVSEQELAAMAAQIPAHMRPELERLSPQQIAATVQALRQRQQ